MNLGQIVQSHALSFFLLSGPDLFLGMDSDPVGRNIIGLIAADSENPMSPKLARYSSADHSVRLRQRPWLGSRSFSYLL